MENWVIAILDYGWGMSIITISRGSFSGGMLLAEELAAATGYRCVDRDTVLSRAAMCGIAQEELKQALETAPSFLERFYHKRYRYLTLIRAALVEELRPGKVIYHGNAGHLLLRGAPHVLRVRVIAPVEFRVAMARQRLQLTAGEALVYIRKVDAERKRWTRCLYGVDWTDAANYDLVLNLEQASIREAASAIYAVLGLPCFQFADECRRAMDELALASRVQASLVLDPATSHLALEATACGGAVWLEGKLTTPEEAVEVERVARAVPGVEAVITEELAAPVYV